MLFKGFTGPKTDQNLSTSRKKQVQPNLFGLDLIYGPILGCGRGHVGSKTDQNLSPSRRAQIFGVFLPENGFQRPPWNFTLILCRIWIVVDFGVPRWRLSHWKATPT